jgi:hypothetical protein
MEEDPLERPLHVVTRYGPVIPVFARFALMLRGRPLFGTLPSPLSCKFGLGSAFLSPLSEERSVSKDEGASSVHWSLLRDAACSGFSG